MNKSKEWKRGYKWGKEYFEKFRSFKRRPDGTYIGYKKGGSTEVIGSLQQYKSSKGSSAGIYTALKEVISEKPVRKVSRKKPVVIYRQKQQSVDYILKRPVFKW
jgi:hypothetical protein